MGAQFDGRTYKGEDLADVLPGWKKDVKESQRRHGVRYSGEIGMLHQDPVDVGSDFESEEHARGYVSEHHDKWEPPLAARFYKIAIRDGKPEIETWWFIGGRCPS